MAKRTERKPAVLIEATQPINNHYFRSACGKYAFRVQAAPGEIRHVDPEHAEKLVAEGLAKHSNGLPGPHRQNTSRRRR